MVKINFSKLPLLVCSLLLVFMLVGCNEVNTYPKGFAVYLEEKETYAIHPEGIVYHVKDVKEKNKADIEFWKKAIETKMTNKGYKKIGEEFFSIGTDKAVDLSYAVPYGTKTYFYRMGVVVREDKIQLVEVGGPSEAMLKQKEPITNAMSSLKKM